MSDESRSSDDEEDARDEVRPRKSARAPRLRPSVAPDGGSAASAARSAREGSKAPKPEAKSVSAQVGRSPIPVGSAAKAA